MMPSPRHFADYAASKAHLYESASEDIDVALGTVSSTDSAATGKQKRRRFSVAYKLQILEEVDSCVMPGQISALLKRERLYNSHISKWRRQRAAWHLEARSVENSDSEDRHVDQNLLRLAELEREKQRLRNRLKHAENIIFEVQRTLSEVLRLSFGMPKE
jgi:transposase